MAVALWREKQNDRQSDVAFSREPQDDRQSGVREASNGGFADTWVSRVRAARRGLSEAQRAMCEATVSIPMVGGVDSLNLAFAGSLMLYEIFRRRKPA